MNKFSFDIQKLIQIVNRFNLNVRKKIVSCKIVLNRYNERNKNEYIHFSKCTVSESRVKRT